ncbi:MAG: acetoacetate decarboxylase family protein [Candidatus Thorarchaeota archaeon]|jgi:hypothetical protein
MTKGKSTPLLSPTYPRPPYHYIDARLFLALFNPPEDAVQDLLPAPLRPSQMPLAGIMVGEMPCKETGTFMEAGLLVQCVFDNPETNEEEVGVRDKTTILKATCKMEDEGAWMDSGPNINAKVIPSPSGEGYDMAVLTAAYLEYTIKDGRSGDVKIQIQSGPRDDLSPVKIDTPMIGQYFDCDMVVPPAKIVGDLKL